MTKTSKNYLGKIKRAIFGFLINNFEKVSLDTKIEKILIGKTAQNREIVCYLFGNGNKKLLFLSAIHGNEVGTIKLNYRLLNYLSKESSPGYKFYFIPCLNKDGYEVAKHNPDYLNGGNQGRVNSNGVDLNRNFDTKSFKSKARWHFGYGYSDSRDIFAGKEAASENETKSLMKFVKQEKISTIICFHNVGKDVMGSKDAKSQKLAQAFNRKSAFRLILENEWKSFGQTGTLKEWCEENSITYLEVEGTNRWGSDWNIQKEAILEVLKEIST
jgi:predicted deacylase